MALDMHKTKRHLLKIVPVLSGVALLFVLAGSTAMLLRSPDDIVETETSDNPETAETTAEEPKDTSVKIEADKNTDWSYEIEDQSIIELSDSQFNEFVSVLNDKTETTHEFFFKGLQEGSTVIRFTSDDGKLVEYSVNVDTDLNATLEIIDNTVTE